MWKILQKITQNLTVAIPVMMLAGFVFGVVVNAAFLKAYIIPFTFLMVYPMMVTLNIQKVFQGGDMKAQVLTQIINFAVVPFLAWAVGLIFFRNSPYMALGLLLAGLVPTSGMTISWTGFARGNLEAAVKMTVIGLTIGSLATPFYVRFLMGASIEINIAAVMKQILLIVFLPMAAGYLTRRQLVKKYGSKRFKQAIGPKFPPLSTLGVIGIVFIAMALKAPAIAASPGMLLYILMPLGLIYAFNFFLSSLVGRLLLPRGDAIALVYGSVMRNLSIALAIAINAFGKEGASAALVVAVAYIIQVQSAAWYVRFTDRIFGPPAPESPEGETEPPRDAPGKADEKPMDLTPARFKKILFATDMSDTARHAARYACGIGTRYKAEVWAIHIVPDVLEAYSAGAGLNVGGRVDKGRKERFNQAEIRRAEARLKERIRTTSRKILEQMPWCPLSEERVMVKTGNPVDEIVRTAAEGGFDLIIMGTHGQKDLEDLFVGSTASGVIETATVPVFVARPA